ncbi:endonuclease MutS2 [Paenibacillus hamazuiensis]|uniref:endonuclease MutS2 n=1 Tax=Paenibacillus hamazuiensis TaxID=2936508 RepID=UPI00200D3D41|nr:DNA mismatch repair protein MutS [Paenibacillus hamazuiensis]
MNELSKQRLEYEKVKEVLHSYCMSYLGRGRVDMLEPMYDARLIRKLLAETEEAKRILRHGSSVPLPALEGIEPLMNLLGSGYVYSEQEMSLFARLLESMAQLRRFMLHKREAAPTIGDVASSMYELASLRSELDRCIRGGRVTDQASKELAKIRKMMAVCEERIKKKLDALMQKYRPYLQDYVVSSRNGRHVLSVKKEHRKMIAGTVLDESSSGQTVFVEPADLAGPQLELSELKREEVREEAKVLSMLTAELEGHEHELKVNLETIGYYDFLFAKAKYALSLDAREVTVNENGVLRFRGGKHPLLGSSGVPLDFALGESYRALIITGPNTGGKTVSLKTVGLLSLMVQSGLQVPVEEGGTFPVYDRVLADIGDGQSIEQSLSTFSSHIRNVIDILRQAGPRSLVLLDELATGTDPGEGVALSIAVLEELARLKASVVATTHFNEIKRFAAQAEGFENARMEFDTETLRPLYRLTIGEAGSSYAFYIAQKLGISPRIIERSREIAARAQNREAPVEAIEPGEARRDGDTQRPGMHPGSAQPPDGIWPAPEGKPDERGAVPWTSNMLASTAQRVSSADDGPQLSASQSSAPHLPGAADPRASQKPQAGAAQHSSARPQPKLEVGDCVWIHSLRRTGIVCERPDARGNVLVQIQKEKVKINIKRLSLYIERKQLYPGDDYDMNIVFESKENRKKQHLMQRKHAEGVMIVKPPDQE